MSFSRVNTLYPASLGTDKFAVSYTYETGASAQYGGNISGATWKHAGGTAQTYGYSYDTYGRLTAGTHSGGNSETIAYDANGNITSLTRTGARTETLAYTYTSGTNRLGTLKSNGSSKTFQYNADGTMKTDGLRTLALTYNYLKLPRTVKRGTTSTVTYIYDTNGNKLAVSQDGTAKNYYCGDFVYDGSLAVSYILTPNGQLTRNPTTGAYTTQYNIPDHLGNVRSVVSSSGTVLQSTDYYPFGLAFSDSNIASNRYLYNGKELEDYTLGTSYLGTLDYSARHYDPRIARWTVPDPMAEKYYGVNAYSYCVGNPVMMVDTNGKEWRDSKGNKIVDHSNIHVYIFYDPKSFKRQSNKMYHDAVVKYGERSVAMSDVTTVQEFAQDWGNMDSNDILEVNLNYHGSNQAIHLDKDNLQYITSTGDGKTNVLGNPAWNVQDLPAPTGDISHAQLNLNTCKSNSKTQHELKGSRQTLMEAFFNSFDFKTVRGTSHGVSYDRIDKKPFPGHSWMRRTWDYLWRPSYQRNSGVGLPSK